MASGYVMFPCCHHVVTMNMATIGNGSKPLITIFGRINSHKPAIVGYLGYQGLDSFRIGKVDPWIARYIRCFAAREGDGIKSKFPQVDDDCVDILDRLGEGWR